MHGCLHRPVPWGDDSLTSSSSQQSASHTHNQPRTLKQTVLAYHITTALATHFRGHYDVWSRLLSAAAAELTQAASLTEQVVTRGVDQLQTRAWCDIRMTLCYRQANYQRRISGNSTCMQVLCSLYSLWVMLLCISRSTRKLWICIHFCKNTWYFTNWDPFDRQ